MINNYYNVIYDFNGNSNGSIQNEIYRNIKKLNKDET